MPSKPMDQKLRIERATVKDPATGCWVWQLKKDPVGYGRMTVRMGSRALVRYSSAHRYAYELWVGPIPEGKCVLHRCDNRACCNPEHLWLGSHSDNMHDMWRKGRGVPRGAKQRAAAIAKEQP